MTSWQSRLLAGVLATTVRPLAARAPLTPRTLRWARHVIDHAVAGTGRLPARTLWQPVRLPTCGAELVRAGTARQVPVVLYFHGGGFVAGSARAWRPFVAALSAHSRAPVLSVDYRLVPEHCVGDAIDDGVHAYRWLREHHGVPARDIVLAGDSAGGGLAVSVALRVRDEFPDEFPDEGLGGLVLMSPWADLTASRPHHGPADPLLSVSCVDRVVRLCEAGAVPEPSPARADLSGLPPTLILTGDRDMLADDSRHLARRLRGAGVECELQLWPGQVHAFPLLRMLPESFAALMEVARFLTTPGRSQCSTGTSPTPSTTRSRP